MLELLRASHGCQKILLTPDFKRDLRWFDKFLPKYNGISMYDHKRVEATLELDACLTGFGGCCGVAFCIVTKSCIVNVNVKMVLSFLECLVSNSCSCCMLANYVLALKAHFVLYDLPFEVLDHPKVKYFVKSIRIKIRISQCHYHSYSYTNITIL